MKASKERVTSSPSKARTTVRKARVENPVLHTDSPAPSSQGHRFDAIGVSPISQEADRPLVQLPQAAPVQRTIDPQYHEELRQVFDDWAASLNLDPTKEPAAQTILPYVFDTGIHVELAKREIEQQLNFVALGKIVAARNREQAIPRFKGYAEIREEEFIEAAKQMKVSEDDARVLYKLARGKDDEDPVTGFENKGSRKPTVKLALKHIQNHRINSAFYVEVDIRNLGGLNAKLGHNNADKVYGDMARIAEGWVKTLEAGAVVCCFRHGGDEFSFVIVGPKPNRGAVERALWAGSKEIQKYLAGKTVDDYQNDGDDTLLSALPHPKHMNDRSKYGTGIVFGVAQMRPDDDVDSVLSAADTEVEAKKH